jgi:hypothetical protein
MNWQKISAIAASVAALATACSEIARNYDIEFHVSRTWDVNEEIPEKAAAKF